MEKIIDYTGKELPELEALAAEGDVRAALVAGKKLYGNCLRYHQRCVDDREDPQAMPEAADAFARAEKWLRAAYDNADCDRTAYRAAMGLCDLYHLGVPSPIFSEEQSGEWRMKGMVLDAKERIAAAFERAQEDAALVRKLVYEQAEKKGGSQFRKIGKALLAGYDDVVTPDAWKRHGYGTAGDAERLGYAFRRLFDRLLAEFEDEAVAGDRRLHDALLLLDEDERRHIEAALVEAGRDDLRAGLHRHFLGFEDIAHLTARSVQKVLRETSTEDLALAMKGASPALRGIFLRNMSRRAADALEDEVDYLGDVPAERIREAQQSVCATVRRLLDEGEILLASGGEWD